MIKTEKILVKLVVLLMFSCCRAYESSSMKLSDVLTQYEQALKDLIAVHVKLNPTKPIDLTPGSEILTTYQRIIQPYLAYIGGYSRMVSSELARNYPYHDDLQKMYEEFSAYQKKVIDLSLLFPSDVQQAVLQIFYKDLAGSMVQTCFNVIQNATYSLVLDDQVLNSAYQAYLLAWAARTSGMIIIGVPQGATFEETITSNMELLFKSAISQVQIQKDAAVNATKSMNSIYAKLKNYYSILDTVYANSGQTGPKKAIQGLLTSIQVQQAAYLKTEKYFKLATTAAQNARSVIVLDPMNGEKVLTQVQNSINAFNSKDPSNLGALLLFQQALSVYQTAQDTIGQQSCTNQINDIEQYDIVMRIIQKLWALFLIDQTAHTIETFPVFESFVLPLASNQYQVSDALSALQHLSSMCSNATGAITQLIDPSGQANLGLQTLTASILKYSQQEALNNTNVNQAALVERVALLQDVAQGLDILVNVCASMTSAVNDTTQIAVAMTYAGQLDSLFAKNSNLTQFIPHLPDIFSDKKTWVNLVAQFFVQAGIVTSAKKATNQVGKAVIAQPTKATIAQLTSLQNKAQAAWTSANQAVSAGNFALASQNYETAMLDYKKLYSMTTSAAQQPQVQQYYLVARSMFVACSFASIPQQIGPSTTLGSLTNIPVSYRSTQYQFQIDISTVGGVLPSFLSASTSAMTTFTATQQSDIFDLVKAYMVQQLLNDQGYHFNNHFSDYHMTTQTQESDTVTKALESVASFVNSFEGVTLTSVSVSSTKIVSVELSNFPIPAITPIFAAMSTALSYFSSAQSLFAPSSTYILVGGQQYYPGNDVSLANLMLENMGYCYSSQAQVHIAQATQQMKKITAQLSSKTQSYPKDFSSQFQQVQKDFVRAQALLYAPGSSAYAYFTQAGSTAQAKGVKQGFLQTYQTIIDFMKQCLIGDPFSHGYQMVLATINQMYVSWNAELDSQADQTQISKNYDDIIQLYVTAGNDCTTTTYTEPTFPNFPQHHYMQAAEYFGAVKHQYKLMGNTEQVTALENKINDMYYDGCNESLKLYFHVKKQTQPYVTYDSVTDGTTKQVTFAQLQQSYANLNNDMSMDEGEMKAYNAVKSLLVNAAMMYEYLGNYYTKQIPQTTTTTTAATTTQAKKKTINPAIDPIILKFLQQQNVIATTATNLPLLDIGVKQKILAVAMSPAYKAWVKTLDPSTFAKTMSGWMNLMFNVVKNAYMQDYLGATTTESYTLLGSQEESFVQAIQKSASSFQNPASVYVG